MENEFDGSWIRRTILIIISVVLLGLIIYFVYILVHNGSTKVSTKNHTPTVSTVAPKSSPSKSTATNTKAVAAPGSSTTSPSTTNPANAQLTNSGPGNVVGLFVISTTLATGSHYLYTRRRLKNSEKT